MDHYTSRWSGPQNQNHQPLTEALPLPSQIQVALGLAKILTKLHELKHSQQYDTEEFVAGRVHGMIQALSFVYDVPFSQAKKILFDD